MTTLRELLRAREADHSDTTRRPRSRLEDHRDASDAEEDLRDQAALDPPATEGSQLVTADRDSTTKKQNRYLEGPLTMTTAASHKVAMVTVEDT